MLQMQQSGMPDWTIRPAHLHDAPALARCIDLAYAAYTGRIVDLPPVSEGIAEDIAENCVWVAELDARIVGGIVVIVRGDHLLLANLAVVPEAGGKGLGRALIDRAEVEAHKRGLPEIRLSTHSAMPENIGLYSRLGWIETGRVGNKVHMSRRLRP